MDAEEVAQKVWDAVRNLRLAKRSNADAPTWDQTVQLLSDATGLDLSYAKKLLNKAYSSDKNATALYDWATFKVAYDLEVLKQALDGNFRKTLHDYAVGQRM